MYSCIDWYFNNIKRNLGPAKPKFPSIVIHIDHNSAFKQELLEPIYTTAAPADLKINAWFKSGQNRPKNNHLALLI